MLVVVVEEGVRVGNRNVLRRRLHAKALHDGVGVAHVHQIARVHAAFGIEHRLHLPERLAQRGTQHAIKQRRAHATVAMLATERAAVLLHQIGHLGGDRHHLGAARGVVDLHQRADMQAADAGMRVVGGLGAMRRHDGAELVHERGQFHGIHGRVLHEGDRLARARHAVQQRLACLAQLPRIGQRPGIFVALHGRVGQRGAQAIEARTHRIHRLRLELHVHDGAQLARGGLRQHFHVVAVFLVRQRRVDHHVIDQLHGARSARQHLAKRRQRCGNAVEAQDGKTGARGLAHDLQHCAHHHRQRAFAAAHQRGQVHLVEGAGRAALELIQQQVHVVAIHVALDVGHAATDLFTQRQHDGREARDHVTLARIALAAALFKARRRAVWQQHVERDQVLHGAPVDDAARARGVVADHAADGGVAAGGHIGPEEEPLGRQGRVQLIQRHARLHRGGHGLLVDVDHAAAVRAEVEHHREVDTLPSKAGATTARQQRQAAFGAETHHALGRLHAVQHHHADGFHLEDAGVGGVQHAVMTTEAHIAGSQESQ